MKKNIFIVFTFIIILIISCSNGNKGKDTKDIYFWHIQNTGKKPVIKEDAVKRFMADNPDYNVILETMQNDPYKTKIKIALGANTAPDVFPTWSGGPMIDYVKAGKLLDLTEYMNKDGYKDRFLDAGINQSTYENKIWAVPVESTSIAMFFYNKKLFEENSWSIPTTIDELEILADKMLAKNVIPFALANKNKWTGSMYYMYLVDRMGGGEVFHNAANRVNGGTFEDPIFIESGKKIVEWVDKGYFNEGFNGLDEDAGQARSLLYTDRAAMYLMASWFLTTSIVENPEFAESGFGIFPFPVVVGGKGDPNTVIGTVGNNFYSISSMSKYPQAAFDLIKYLIDDKSIEDKVLLGDLPPVKNLKVEDSKLQMVLDIANKAPSVQLWYDQYLPSELAEVHKDTLQAIFAKTMTPQEAAAELEAKATEILGPSSK